MTTAVRGLTGTGEFSVVMGVAIVERQLGSGLDKAESIKLCPFSNNSHERIGGAGMVDKPESAGLLGSVDGFVIIDFNYSNPLLSFGALSPFSLCNKFPFVLADFLPCSQRDFGE